MVLRGISSSFFYTNSTCRCGFFSIECGFFSKFNLVAGFSKSSSLGRRRSYGSHLSYFSHPSNSRFVQKPRPSLRGFSVTMAAAPSLDSSQKMVLVPIATGTEEMEAVILIDILRRAGSEVTVASVEETLQIVASRNVKLVADSLISECEKSKYDLVVLPGGMPGAERLRDSQVLKKIVQQLAEEGRLYAAICAAPAVALEPWGLLKGLKATCHPSFTKKLQISEALELRVVKDGLATTSRGPGTAIEFALALVEQLYNKQKVEELSKALVLRTQSKFGPAKRDYNSTKWFSASEGKVPLVLVPIAHGSEEMEAVIIIDILRRAAADVVVGSVEETLQITASRKVQIIADKFVKDLLNSKFDVVILPGGMPGAQRLRDSEELSTILKEQAEGNRAYGAICAAPAVVLEAKNLLKVSTKRGKKATSYPAFADKLSDKSASDARVVIDGLVATSQGPGTAMEYALSIVEKLFGQEKAANIAEAMVFPYQ
ncbi:hypothetical protein O6H91_06G047900 [Diphasiastrum complanatum]|uniref:Uncharacterized protein n=1 Tax=Diphasiastrum complanatum TaxID=34168 RepID=A0ACC2DDQ5_DIPCM|nr:hypothetical protein O6H91_06G047900 [Diphasiastrum complanatum]